MSQKSLSWSGRRRDNLREIWRWLYLLGIRCTPLANPRKKRLIWLFGPKVLLASKAVIVDRRGRLLLVHSLWSGAWELPGGLVNRGEQPEHAIRRECREELGLDVISARLLTVATSSAGLDTTAYYRCTIADGPIRLSVEHTGYRFVEPGGLPVYFRMLLDFPEGRPAS